MESDPFKSSEIPADVESAPQTAGQETGIAFWIVLAFFGGGFAGCTASSAVFHCMMDVDADGLHADSDLMSATALIMLLCGLLFALVTWRWNSQSAARENGPLPKKHQMEPPSHHP
jgi:hypothetical protein